MKVPRLLFKPNLTLEMIQLRSSAQHKGAGQLKRWGFSQFPLCAAREHILTRMYTIELMVTYRPRFTHTQQDASSMKTHKNSTIFSVCDGHGGESVANHVKESLPQEIVKQFSSKYTLSPHELQAALTAAYFACDNTAQEMLHRQDSPVVGSTAVVCIVTPSHVAIANCGDSRGLIISPNGKVSRVCISFFSRRPQITVVCAHTDRRRDKRPQAECKR
jgi:hypothetical protein